VKPLKLLNWDWRILFFWKENIRIFQIFKKDKVRPKDKNWIIIIIIRIIIIIITMIRIMMNFQIIIIDEKWIFFCIYNKWRERTHKLKLQQNKNKKKKISYFEIEFLYFCFRVNISLVCCNFSINVEFDCCFEINSNSPPQTKLFSESKKWTNLYPLDIINLNPSLKLI